MVTITKIPLFPEEPPDSSIEYLAINLIETNDIGPKAKPALVAQIKAFGILEPIKVIPIKESSPAYERGFRYEVIDGRRRLDAAWKASLTIVPAVVIAVGRDEAYSSLIALASHALRSENHAWELAKIQEMIAKGSTEIEIARHSGMTIAQIKERMRLLSLIADLRDSFDSGTLSFSQAKRIASMPEPIQHELAETLAENGKLTSSDIKAVMLARRSSAAETVAFDLGDLDDDLSLRPEDSADPIGEPLTMSASPRPDPEPELVTLTVELAVAREVIEQIVETVAQAIDLIATRRGKEARKILGELLEAYRPETALDIAVSE